MNKRGIRIYVCYVYKNIFKYIDFIILFTQFMMLIHDNVVKIKQCLVREIYIYTVMKLNLILFNF